ncbi:MAG: DMT family transporter [Coleofasciculaceae cyanobacterium SM2_1_6]|nr:DMT family transporter [Coleofasciculaceae cyanobacterium SM2_1_6]
MGLPKIPILNFQISPGILYALIACVLFGSNAPIAKVLLQEISPQLLTALLNTGAAFGLSVLIMGRYLQQNFFPPTDTSLIQQSPPRTPDNFLQGRDWFWFAITTLLGGVTAPTLFIYGVSQIPASIASLLLSFEGMATAVIAWILFKEKFHWLVAVAIALILAGTVILNSGVNTSERNFGGTLAVVTAGFCWATDNNLTRKIAHRDPLPIALGKNIAAGIINGSIALSLGTSLPPLGWMLLACTLGIFSYGLSFTFLIMALRLLGASRAGAYFSITPFVGTGLSIIFLRDPITPNFLVAAILIALGVSLCIYEQLRNPS